MSKQFWALIVVIVLVLVGVFIFTGHKNTNTGSASQPTEHIEGKGSTGVTLVEYGDYECPYCQVYFATVKQVEAEYDSQITFQFRNFPLTSIHPNAFAGARAAEAAALQGKFWEMHDLLYEENDPNAKQGWVVASDPTTYFDEFATSIGLNLTQFKADYASIKVNNLINADMSVGNKLNIQGTPTFFVDGKQVQIGNTVANFESVINAAIKSKTSSSASSSTGTASSGTTTQTKK
jgi:protein-disulfide isomerase